MGTTEDGSTGTEVLVPNPSFFWPDLHGVHVVLIEDNDDTRTIIGETLRHCGAVVNAYHAADAASAHLTDFIPTVLVCDLSLPGLDGLQFMRRTRALPPESGGRVPAIAITAYYEEFVAAAALEAGFDLYMIKPIQLEELCRVAGDLARGGPKVDGLPLGRVLIVEDEREVAAMLHDVLVDLGYHVQEAVSGPAALGLLAVYQPDVVLLDLLLPGMSGEEALEHLQRADAHLPVIVVSASRDPDLTRRTLACGAFDYVQKPFDIAVLCRSVADALGVRRGRS